LTKFSRNKLTYFFFGQFLSIFAGLFGWSALAWHIVSTYGAAGTAKFMTVQAVAYLFAHVLLSPIGDRYDKLKVMKWFSWLVAVRASLLVYAVSTADVSLNYFIALQVVNSIAMSAIIPSRASLLVDLVPPDQVAGSYGVQRSIESSARILGPMAGGLALMQFSIATCLIVHAVLMVVTCALNYGLADRVEKTRPTNNKPRMKSWLRDIADIWTARLAIPMERALGIMGLLVTCAYLPAMTMLIPIRVHQENWSTLYFGASEGMLAVGTLMAGFGLGSRMIKHAGRHRVLVYAGFVQGAALIGAGLAPIPALFALCYFLVGLCGTTAGMAIASHRMLATPPNFRARLSAASMSVTMLAGSIGSYVSGMALQSFSVQGVQAFLGGVVLLGAMGNLLIPRLKEFLGLTPQEADSWYEKEYPDAFK